MRTVLTSMAVLGLLCFSISAQSPFAASSETALASTETDERLMSPRIYHLQQKPSQEIFDVLLKTIEPGSWKYAGGEADFVWVSSAEVLVVRQNRAGHEQVEAVLSQLDQLATKNGKVAPSDEDPCHCRTQFEPGDKVEIEWRGTWYPGEILKFEEGRYYIHYDNYGDHWDEWATTDRLRMPQ